MAVEHRNGAFHHERQAHVELLAGSEHVRQTRQSTLMERSIHAAGWRNDMDRFYSAGDIQVFTAAEEAYGNVIAEAMTAGPAVITTRTGVAKACIRDGKTGRFIDPQNAEGLARVISELLTDSELRRSMGLSAGRYALEHFSQAAAIGSYNRVYRELSVAAGPQ